MQREDYHASDLCLTIVIQTAHLPHQPRVCSNLTLSAEYLNCNHIAGTSFQEACDSLRLHYVLPAYFIWDPLLQRQKCPWKCILASIHDYKATGWGGTRLTLTWKREVASIRYVYGFRTCPSWIHLAPSRFSVPSPIHVSFLLLGEMDGTTFLARCGSYTISSQLAPPALQMEEAVNMGKPLAVGLGQGTGKTMVRACILTLKCLNWNRWD